MEVYIVRVPDASPEEWRVEAFDQGSQEIMLFSGPDAEEQAREYVARAYPGITPRETPRPAGERGRR